LFGIILLHAADFDSPAPCLAPSIPSRQISAMSKKKKGSPVSAPATLPAPTPATATPADESDPHRRMIANITLVVFSLYVAMIWLLALDQQFHWGIFKP
jgi:hypothetical protein